MDEVRHSKAGVIGGSPAREKIPMDGVMQQLPAEEKLLAQLRGFQCCRLPKLFPNQWLL